MNLTHIIHRRDVPSIASTIQEEMHPVLARIYASRNITSIEQLDYSFNVLHNWQDFKSIDTAVELLIGALQSQQHIIIVGDFDVILRI